MASDMLSHHHHHRTIGNSHDQQHFADNLQLLALAAELIDTKGYDEMTSAAVKSASGLATHPDPRYYLPFPDSILEIAYWAGVYDPDHFPRP
eukprot:gene8494-9360_t